MFTTPPAFVLHDDGGVPDAGTTHVFDSYLNVALAAGTYAISVDRFSDAKLGGTQDYVLHISAEGHAVPEPGSLALVGLALAAFAFAPSHCTLTNFPKSTILPLSAV